MAKVKVVVLYGGRSTEHEVSCRSAAFVLKNLDVEKYDIVPVAIDKQGHWLPQSQDVVRIAKSQAVPVPLQSAVPASPQSVVADHSTVVFPVLHGTFGEDGSMQGLLDLADVAYVGPDTLGSAIGMDKVVCKKLVAGVGVPIVPYTELRKQHWTKHRERFLDDCERTLQYPMFVKPARLGSSVGITKVKQGRQNLAAACDEAFRFDEKILVETGLNVRELECAVLGDYEPAVSVVGEIDVTAAAEFYSYDAKYNDAAAAKISIPANITAVESLAVQEMAKKIFAALELYGMARIDLFMERDTRKIYFNEVNTIPGFTQISQYPMLWAASGVNSSQLLDRLIDLAIKRRDMRHSLQRTKV